MSLAKDKGHEEIINPPLLSCFHCNFDKEYEIDAEPFASGVHGKIYKGKRKSDNLIVAIKILDGQTLQQSDSNRKEYFSNQKHLLHELNNLAIVHHPFCLPLINFSLTPNPVIITPFMPNGDLMKLIFDTNPKLATQKLCSLYAICLTMHFLHSVGIIHRDIKPTNIFIKENNDICIGDFGESKKVTENCDLTSEPIGSFAYIAPELVLREDYDNKIDVFSFGVIYYQFVYMKSGFILNDKKTPPTKEQAFMNRVAFGARLFKPLSFTNEQYKLYLDCTNQKADERPSFGELADRFESDKSIWFGQINENQFRDYVEKCKKINKESIEKHKNLMIPENLGSSNFTRSTVLKPKAQSKRPHIRYEDK